MIAKNLFEVVALFSLQCCMIQFAFAQNKVITGKVTEREDGSVIARASIVAKNANAGTLTDSNGNFRIVVPDTERTLTISHIGFVPQVIDVTQNADLVISLVSGISPLDEAIVTGYGTLKRKDITGSVERLTINEFNRGIITNPLQQAQSKIAGVLITQAGGDPNGDFIVRIRGATSLEGQPPLLVINGVAIDDFHKAINRLNPADIESFDILKDASAAAIYGARGGNGVIIITTKHGRQGKMSLGYDAFVGVEKIANKLKVLSANDWRKATGTGGQSLDKGANTDWQNEITRSAISHSHTISLSGGNNEMNYRGSVGYTRQEGIILNTAKELFSIRLVADQSSLNNRLKVTYDINNTVIKRDFLPDQASTSQVRSNGTSLFENVLQTIPVIPVYNPDGTFYQTAGGSRVTPVILINTVYSKLRENFFQGSAKGDYELIRGLNVGLLGAISRGNDVYDFFDASRPTAVASKSNSTKQLFSGDMHINYRKQFQKHTIDVTGTYEYNDFVNDGFAVRASGFLVPALLNNNLGTATTVLTDGIASFKNQVKLVSYLGRAIYNFDNRFILTANFRRDGSSRFGAGNRWGNFPSVAVAWRMNNETFLGGVSWLNNLKVRVSYGLTGNQENLPPNAYQLLYGRAGAYLYDGQFLQSYSVMQEDNPDLKWEVRKSFNAGVDLTILNERVSGTIDIFDDRTSDMLFFYGVPQPPFLTNQVYANAANAINKGVEISMKALVVNAPEFDWNIQINIATVKNRITNLSGKFRGADLNIGDPRYGYADGRGLSGAYVSKLEVGYPAGVLWLPQHAGFDPAGNELFNNYDENGKFAGVSTFYNDKDRVLVDATPHFSWGLNNSFSYKNFDLNIFIRGVQGQKIFANSLMNLESRVLLPSSNVLYNALTNGFANQPQPSDYWVRSGSFIRLENISLEYNFGKIKNLDGLKIYLTASNLFVITGYEGIDPEIKVEGRQRYIDANYYPKTRALALGVNLKL
jgi:TonB-dependent starch-binding outer membrane protein SusC